MTQHPADVLAAHLEEWAAGETGYVEGAQVLLAALAGAGYAVVPAERTRQDWASGPADFRVVAFSELTARRRAGGAQPLWRRIVHYGPWEAVPSQPASAGPVPDTAPARR